LIKDRPEKQAFFFFSLRLKRFTPATNPDQYRPLISMNMQPTVHDYFKKTNSMKQREHSQRAEELIPEETELIEKPKESGTSRITKEQMVVKNNLLESLQIKNMITKINNRWPKEQNLHNRR
jgi:hypothetical protein